MFWLVRRIFDYYPNYPTHRLYFGEVETPYSLETRSVIPVMYGVVTMTFWVFEILV